MPTECNPALFEFPPVEGRQVVASFDGGAITSDAGALLLGQADRALRLTERFAACFADTRTAGLVEHQVETMVMQRVVGIALGYEDLNDHDELRRDPVLAVLAGKLAAQRSDCAPLAGKSTLNRLELSRVEPTRYHKISHDAAAIESLMWTAPRVNLRMRPPDAGGEPPEGACLGSSMGPVSPDFIQYSAGLTLAHAASSGTSRMSASTARCSSPNPSGLRREMNTSQSIQAAI